MDHETIRNATWVIGCLVMSAFIMNHFRRYFQPRNKGEKLTEFIARARIDEKLDKEAFVHMFGANSRWAHLTNTLLSFVWIWSITELPDMTIIGLLYLAIGAFTTRVAAGNAKQADYNRLRFGNRIWHRMYYAWTWPLHMLKGTSKG